MDNEKILIVKQLREIIFSLDLMGEQLAAAHVNQAVVELESETPVADADNQSN